VRLLQSCASVCPQSRRVNRGGGTSRVWPDGGARVLEGGAVGATEPNVLTHDASPRLRLQRWRWQVDDAGRARDKGLCGCALPL